MCSVRQIFALEQYEHGTSQMLMPYGVTCYELFVVGCAMLRVTSPKWMLHVNNKIRKNLTLGMFPQFWIC